MNSSEAVLRRQLHPEWLQETLSFEYQGTTASLSLIPQCFPGWRAHWICL